MTLPQAAVDLHPNFNVTHHTRLIFHPLNRATPGLTQLLYFSGPRSEQSATLTIRNLRLLGEKA